MKNMSPELFELKVSQRSKIAYADIHNKLEQKLSAVGHTLYSAHTTKPLDERIQIVIVEILGMNRTVTPSELVSEAARVDQLAAAAVKQINAIDSNGTEKLCELLRQQNYSREVLCTMTANTARELLNVIKSGRMKKDAVSADEIQKLEKVVEAYKNGVLAASDVSSDELLDFISTYAMTLGKIDFVDNNGSKDRFSWIASAEADDIALEAVKGLRATGALPEKWDKLSDDQIFELFQFARRDPLVHLTNEELIDRVIDQTAKAVIYEFLESRDANAPRVDAADIPERVRLGIAVAINMRKTGELPEEFENLSDEDLATLVTTSIQLGFIFDEAVAGKISCADFFEIAKHLIAAAFYGFITALLVAALIAEGLSVVSFLIAFIALGSGFGVCEEIAEAVNIFCAKMFPAGLSETRVGRAVKNFGRDIEYTIYKIFRAGSGSSSGAGNPPGDDGTPATADIRGGMIQHQQTSSVRQTAQAPAKARA